ncbi:Uracil phosphoribosyltransferase [Carpediemonas membranifera]|uniref:uracil phosphoribosyltransferase n=1 Tax=Carpediemonas membranifera TaxID=201153 RepID=A0A8J6BFS8_9EUKA|nr:Uracil phosphoribosyltransferase [Carpediemonas membranifera]|eukprot:KAG9396567.1 Uracil phosphoribosyltransferase [Carpediemonas membranifera]
MAKHPELLAKYPNVEVLPSNGQVRCLFASIRNSETSRRKFVFDSDRLITMLVEAALAKLPYKERTVKTPMGLEYVGAEFCSKLVGVPIVRAGESMEKALSNIIQEVRIGKILIQRDEETALPVLIYEKMPRDIANRHVLLLDPMLATGGSAMAAVKVLLDHGVKEDHIIFVNLISCPEGIDAFCGAFPQIRVVTGEIDDCLDERKYICPGIGDFGDRYFGTDI